MIAELKALLANPRLHAGWAVVSAALLFAAAWLDPYLFGLCAFIAAGISGLLSLVTAIANWRRLPWPILAAIPTLVAFLRLSTYKWA